MSTRVSRKEAIESIHANVQDESIIKQMLHTELIMRALAKRLNKDIKEWGITGLLHDIDIELVEDDPSSHGRLGADIAHELGANERMVYAILAHNIDSGMPRKTDLDISLQCSIALTELLATVGSSSTIDMDAKSIAAGLNQHLSELTIHEKQVSLCKELGLELEEFISLGINALRSRPSGSSED